MIPTAHPTDRPTPAPLPLSPSKAPLPGKAPALPLQDDRTASVPLPLSQREQQVCEYLSQGVSFEAIARDLNCSPAAARAYHRRALCKRQRTIALASLEQGDSSAQGDRPSSASAYRCNRSPFHRPAVALSPAFSGPPLAKRVQRGSSTPSDCLRVLGLAF